MYTNCKTILPESFSSKKDNLQDVIIIDKRGHTHPFFNKLLLKNLGFWKDHWGLKYIIMALILLLNDSKD